MSEEQTAKERGSIMNLSVFTKYYSISFIQEFLRGSQPPAPGPTTRKGEADGSGSPPPGRGKPTDLIMTRPVGKYLQLIKTAV